MLNALTVLFLIRLLEVFVSGGFVCPGLDWVLDGSTCYKIISGSPSDGQTRCNNEESNAILMLAPSSTVAAHVDTLFSGEKIWVSLRLRNGAEWFWDNGSNGPDTWGSSPILPQLCIITYPSGLMHDYGCNRLAGLICQKDLDLYGLCAQDWTKIGTHCFKRLRHHTTSGVNFGDARLLCNDENAFVMMPQSQSVAKEIKATLDCGDFCWVGVTDFDADHIYKWEDDTYINQSSLYFDGARNQPDNRDLDYICAYIQNGQFYNGECKTSHRVICKFDEASTTVSNTKDPESTDIETKAMAEHVSTALQVSTHLSAVVNKTSTENSQRPTPTTKYTYAATSQTTHTQSNKIIPTTSQMEKSNCSKSSSNSCRCQKRTVANTTENQEMQTLKVTDYIWLNKCSLQPLIDAGMVDVANCPYECKCSPKGSTTSQEVMYACVRRP